MLKKKKKKDWPKSVLSVLVKKEGVKIIITIIILIIMTQGKYCD